MPTANVLGGGITINEFVAIPTTDFNNDGNADSGDAYFELYNTSGSPIDINGYTLYGPINGAFDMSTLVTISGSTIIPPGGTFVIVSGSGGGSPINITGPGVIMDTQIFSSPFGMNVFLADSSAGSANFIHFGETNGSGFVSGDITASGLTAANQVGTSDTFTFSNAFDTSWSRFPDGEDGFTELANSATPGVTNLCFAAGTLIETPDGECAVESLNIGDRVLTQNGQAVRVEWLGRQTIQAGRMEQHNTLVRIKAGALGDRVPHSDLTVTADHGMVFSPSSSEAVGERKDYGHVINASALVNHDTIDFVPMEELEDSFTVYHIETEAHDVILANGAPSETFVDVVTRSHFDNYQEYLDLYGVERIIPEMPIPRISSARLVPASIKKRLNTKNPTALANIA